MLMAIERDLSELDFMFVPSNNQDQRYCWLDCIGIHSQTKVRQTYEKAFDWRI